MNVPQYTTPVFTLTFTEETLDLTQADSVYVTFVSANLKLTKTGTYLTVGEKTITVHLTQAETGQMKTGVDIQANWMVGTERYASEIKNVRISGNLLDEVIT